MGSAPAPPFSDRLEPPPVVMWPPPPPPPLATAPFAQKGALSRPGLGAGAARLGVDTDSGDVPSTDVPSCGTSSSSIVSERRLPFPGVASAAAVPNPKGGGVGIAVVDTSTMADRYRASAPARWLDAPDQHSAAEWESC